MPYSCAQRMVTIPLVQCVTTCGDDTSHTSAVHGAQGGSAESSGAYSTLCFGLLVGVAVPVAARQLKAHLDLDLD